MVNNSVGDIRRSAVVMSYAPGAIMDMRAEGAPVSGVSAGLEEWDLSAPLTGNLKNQKIIERRLCAKLGKRYFRLPPILEEDAKLPNGDPDPASLVMRRFPRWLQCPKCDALRQAGDWANDPGRAYQYCARCTSQAPGQKKVFVVPVRFATACTHGHLDEFPWHHWVRHKAGCAAADGLTLKSVAPGLSGLWVSCPSCKARMSLDGAFRKTALAGLRCLGKRPWLQRDDLSCDCTGDAGTFRVVQRGASNLYYPLMESALDIPPWTSWLEDLLADYWDDLRDVEDRDQRLLLINVTPTLKARIDREGVTAERVCDVFDSMVAALDQVEGQDLRLDEYMVFTAAGPGYKHREFETYPSPAPGQLGYYFSSVVRVARLREVRAVRGFTRIFPPFDPDGPEIAPLSMSELDWLPAIEIRGEGIFLGFREDALRDWEELDSVTARAAVVEANWAAEWDSRADGRPLPFEATPRLLLVHTFAHALIRQLTLECGYSSASLRERLYVSEGSDGMAGVLIYTGTPDSDGTLGGLQRRARSDLLEPTILGAIMSMEWCSSDPLCIHGEMAAPEALSVANCHACVMLPETSCEHSNRFLDRGMLIGTESDPSVGFFRKMLGR